MIGTDVLTLADDRSLTRTHSKLTYIWEQYLFHYVSEGGYTYLVMADDSAGR